VDLIQRQVRFKIRDVHFPEIGELLLELHGNDVLQGKVIDVTDNSESGRPFAVIQLDGVDRLSIVAIDNLQELP
jgi:hypothetical protein